MAKVVIVTRKFTVRAPITGMLAAAASKEGVPGERIGQRGENLGACPRQGWGSRRSPSSEQVAGEGGCPLPGKRKHVPVPFEFVLCVAICLPVCL